MSWWSRKRELERSLADTWALFERTKQAAVDANRIAHDALDLMKAAQRERDALQRVADTQNEMIETQVRIITTQEATIHILNGGTWH